jgi:hypothetical protein
MESFMTCLTAKFTHSVGLLCHFTAMKRSGGLFRMLQLAFPNIPWDPAKFEKKFAGGKSQQALTNVVRQLLPPGSYS